MIARNNLLKLLRMLTMLIPPLPFASAISNKIVKKLYCALFSGEATVIIWGDITMTLDPCDCVGGNLCFLPHLYDRWERSVLAQYLKPEMTFIDLGANIGAYSLWASKYLGPSGTIIAIEADPVTFHKLTTNLNQNHLDSQVLMVNSGISDKEEELDFFRNTSDNAGANSFVVAHGEKVKVKCNSLAEVLNSLQVMKVDFLKIDIEGFELKVLKKFLHDAKKLPSLKPEYLLIEIVEGPLWQNKKLLSDMLELLRCNDYILEGQKGNSLFRLDKAENC